MEHFLAMGGGANGGYVQPPLPTDLDEVDDFFDPVVDDIEDDVDAENDEAALHAYMQRVIAPNPSTASQNGAGRPGGGGGGLTAAATPTTRGALAAPDDNYGDADDADAMLAGELSEDEMLFEHLGVTAARNEVLPGECFLCDFAAGEYPTLKDTRLSHFIADVHRDETCNFGARHYIALAQRYEKDIRAPANAMAGAVPLPAFTARDIYDCTHFHKRPDSERIADETIHLFRSIMQTVRRNSLVERNPRQRRRDGRFSKMIVKDQFKIVLDASREIRQLLPYASNPVKSDLRPHMQFAPNVAYTMTRFSTQKRAAEQAATTDLGRPVKRSRRGY